MCLAESSCNKSQSGQLRLAVTDANTPQSLNARLSELFGAPPFSLNPEVGQSSSSSWSCSSSTQWASVAGKAPDLPATILFRWCNGEILGFSRTKDDDEHEDDLLTSAFGKLAKVQTAKITEAPYLRVASVDWISERDFGGTNLRFAELPTDRDALE